MAVCLIGKLDTVAILLLIGIVAASGFVGLAVWVAALVQKVVVNLQYLYRTTLNHII